MRANRKWHTTGDRPSGYPNGADMGRFFVLRVYPGGRYDVSIEPWVTDTDFSNGNGLITPAHFSYWGTGRLVGWQPLPPPITEDPTDWLSEYRGDDNPDESGVYLCTVTRDNKRFGVKGVYWDSRTARWSTGDLWAEEEVLAWRAYPDVPADMTRAHPIKTMAMA